MCCGCVAMEGDTGHRVAAAPLLLLILLLVPLGPASANSRRGGRDVPASVPNVPAATGQCQCIMLVLRCENHALTTLRHVLDQSYRCVLSESYVAINVNMNNITTIDVPREFFARYSISHFWADNNQLRSLDGLSQWTGHYLAVGYNQLKRMEGWFLARLQILSVENNMLEDLDLSSSKRLRWLNAANNFIRRLVAPKEQCALQQLTLRGNALRELPSSLDACAALTHVDVAHNRLTSFDLPAPTPNVQRLVQRYQQMPVGDHTKNHLNCSLQSVDVSYNNLTHMTDALAWCGDLRLVNASNNRLRRIPVGLLLLMVLRPERGAGDGVLVDLRGNPLEASDVKEDIGRFLSAGYGYSKTPSLSDCGCAAFKRLRYATVTYCITSMCANDQRQLSMWREVP